MNSGTPRARNNKRYLKKNIIIFKPLRKIDTKCKGLREMCHKKFAFKKFDKPKGKVKKKKNGKLSTFCK